MMTLVNISPHSHSQNKNEHLRNIKCLVLTQGTLDRLECYTAVIQKMKIMLDRTSNNTALISLILAQVLFTIKISP